MAGRAKCSPCASIGTLANSRGIRMDQTKEDKKFLGQLGRKGSAEAQEALEWWAENGKKVNELRPGRRKHA